MWAYRIGVILYCIQLHCSAWYMHGPSEHTAASSVYFDTTTSTPQTLTGVSASPFQSITVNTPDALFPVTTIPYNHFQIRIFALSLNPSGSTGLYYAPACTFVPNSTYIIRNNHQSYVAFATKLWDAEYQDYVSNELSKLTGIPQKPQMIPFHSMRVDVIDNTIPIKVMNQWIPISHQPSVVLGRIICLSDNECTSIRNAIENPEDQFLFGLEVSFAMKKPNRTKRSIPINKPALEASESFQTIKQKLPQNALVCMQNCDLRRLLREVLDGALETTTSAEEFVSENQLFPAVNRLMRLIKPNVTSTADFTDDDWTSVYWPMGSIRPDEKIKSLNELLGNGNKWMKAFFQIGSNFSALDGIKPLQDVQPQMDWSTVRAQLKETSGTVHWNGDKFVIKPMTLYCVNRTLLLSSEQGTVSVSSSPKASNLVSAVNIAPLNKIPIDLEMQRLKRSVNQTEQQLLSISSTVSNMVPIGSIMAYHQDKGLPPCWLQCDGSTFSNVTYPLLASALSPRMCTPDLRGKFPMGVEQNGPWSFIGQSGGEASHVLTVAEMPEHKHDIPKWPGSDNFGNFDEAYKLTVESVSDRRDRSNRGDGKKLTSANTGSGMAHNNLPPFITTRYIIRAC